jgi:chemotaxis protein MotB
MADNEQIIIIKRKSGHAAHHGGAWKVAYADFVTAMMALFIVLWLMNSSKPVQDAVGGYFRDPNGTAQKEDMSKLKDDLMKSMEKMKDFDKLKKLIEMTVTPEGLQIELMEDPQGTFFETGSAEPTHILQNLLRILAPEAGKLPNPISIEGHTDSTPYSGGKAYGNWELSTDRANTARRLMESNGIRPSQVVQVRGYADRKLRKPQQPNDASNRRITVIIQYVVNPAQAKVIVSNGTLPAVR